MGVLLVFLIRIGFFIHVVALVVSRWSTRWEASVWLLFLGLFGRRFYSEED
jgi:hypothetical protein